MLGDSLQVSFHVRPKQFIDARLIAMAFLRYHSRTSLSTRIVSCTLISHSLLHADFHQTRSLKGRVECGEIGRLQRSPSRDNACGGLTRRGDRR